MEDGKSWIKEDGKMSILVLGGAGYIGSHTVYELIDAGEGIRRFLL